MNFFASPQYLNVVADVYFPGQATRIADVRIDDEILRLLVVEERQAITEVPFLDYHQPLLAHEIGTVEAFDAYAPWVARSIVTRTERHDVASHLGPSPFVDWSNFATYDDYVGALTAHHARRLRNIRRLRHRLDEDLGFVEFCSDDTRSDVVDFALRWKSWQFHATGLPDLFADRRNVQFFEVLRQRNLLKASSLRAGGRLLSVWLGFEHDGVWSGWIFTYDRDPALKSYSPGHQLLQSMLKHSKTSGHREFDFSVGGQDYKWLYATHARVLGSLGHHPRMPRTLRAFAEPILRRTHLYGTARFVRRAARRLTGL